MVKLLHFTQLILVRSRFVSRSKASRVYSFIVFFAYAFFFFFFKSQIYTNKLVIHILLHYTLPGIVTDASSALCMRFPLQYISAQYQTVLEQQVPSENFNKACAWGQGKDTK